MYRDDIILRFYSAQSSSHNNLVSKLFDRPVIGIDKTAKYFHRTMKGITVGQVSKVSSVRKGRGPRETERPQCGMENQASVSCRRVQDWVSANEIKHGRVDPLYGSTVVSVPSKLIRQSRPRRPSQTPLFIFKPAVRVEHQASIVDLKRTGQTNGRLLT